jgi:hypothetical protein
MIVTIEASLSGSKRSLLAHLLDFVIEYIEGGTERAWQVILRGEQRRPIGSKDTQIEFGVEEGDLQAVAGRGIAVGLRHAVDQPLESKAPEVIRHLRGGIRATPEGFHLRAEVAIAKAARQMSKADEALQERHDARIAEAQRGDPLPGDHGRLLEAVEGVLGEHAVMTDALHFEQLAIDLFA